MASTFGSVLRTHFKQRPKVVRSSRSQSQAHHRWVNLVLGYSPEDSSPESIEEATKWLDNVVGELGSGVPAKDRHYIARR